MIGLLTPLLANAQTEKGTGAMDMKARVQTCVACHGDQGKASPEGYYPRIAGKPQDYLFNQLVHFREGRRTHSTMNYLVQNLSDDYLMQMAAYFAQQHPPYPKPLPSKVKPDILARGKQLVLQGDPSRKLPACAACHGEQLTGLAPTMPGLLGLPRDYLNAQLGAWLKGQRKAAEPDCMASIVKTLTTEELSMATAYLASIPLPADPKPKPQGNIKFPMECGTHNVKTASTSSTSNTTPVSSNPLEQSIQRGAYLSKLGNCAGCHTQAGGKPYAGGRAILTPFGDIYATNLTPDATSGLGTWSADDFYRAMHEGKSKNGKLLYPAFPYNNFTQMSRQETDDLFAYLRTQTAVQQATPEPSLKFPYNQRQLMRVWQALYFKQGEYKPDTTQSAEWNRGNYLANGPGHCNACHTPRNAMGGLDMDSNLAGATIPVLNWYAPSLNNSTESGLGKRTVEDIVQVLKTGQSEKHATYGPMAEVVRHSLQHWSDPDLRAMVVYLKSLPAQNTSEKPPKTMITAAAQPGIMRQGATLYKNQCADCHGQNGEGKANQFPALAGNNHVTDINPANSILMILNGGYAPSTAGNPYPHGMPPFRNTLKLSEVAILSSYLRNSWGNKASFVSEIEVEKLRAAAR
ncbi:MAG: c-type cytochrome [Limnobacter sp.]|nr:c-type cytochrome [Limnobacter sp.]